jgi:hypothetical protein
MEVTGGGGIGGGVFLQLDNYEETTHWVGMESCETQFKWHHGSRIKVGCFVG